MVTCNLNSINLGRITDEELEANVALQIRMLDNVISINQFPVPEAKMTSEKYRAIGLGTSGYHHYLVRHQIQWESEEHIETADKLFENIAYYAIKASMELAKEKRCLPCFQRFRMGNRCLLRAPRLYIRTLATIAQRCS